MSLPRSEVQRWLDRVAPGVGLTRLALDAGLPRLRLVQQIGSGSVGEQTVATIARSLNLAPLRELSQFSALADLAPAPPSPGEVLSLVRPEAMLRAAADRLAGQNISEEQLQELGFPELTRQWFDACDTGELRGHLKAKLGLSQSGLWRMFEKGLRPDVAVVSARWAGFPIGSALVVSRVLTPTEAGWPVDERAALLNAMPLSAVLRAAESRAHELGLREKQAEDFEQNLG